MISCRRHALRAGSRAGRIAGLAARATKRTIGRAEAKLLSRDYVVPERWRPIFVRAFVRGALVFSR